MTEQITNRRAEDKNVQVLATKIEGLAQDMNEMKHGIAKMADALTKLAIVEERQTQTILAQERAFKALERASHRHLHVWRSGIGPDLRARGAGPHRHAQARGRRAPHARG